MSTPLQEFSKKYFKRPDCWRSLLILGGVLLVDKFFIDYHVKNYIFGNDGHGGEVLLIQSRMDHHEQEFREERKKYYWHQRLQKFYIPSGHTLNTKVDYKTLSYNSSHLESYLDPREIPTGHNHENDTFSFVASENFSNS